MERNPAHAGDRRRVSRIPRELPSTELWATPQRVPGAIVVPIDKVERDPAQPRHDWRHDDGDERLDELTQSIKDLGLLQPLVVRRAGDRYVVIAGGRRLVAAQRAGLREIPVIVRDEEGAHARVLQLIENLQRQQLSSLDEARAYQELMEIEGLTTGAVAARVHVSTQTVRDRLRLLRDQVLADAVERRHISATVAREINKLPDEAAEELRARVQAGERLQVADVAEMRAQLAAAGVVNPRWNPRRMGGPGRSSRQETLTASEASSAGLLEDATPSAPPLSPAGRAASELLPSHLTPPAVCDDAPRPPDRAPLWDEPAARQVPPAPVQPAAGPVIAQVEREEAAGPAPALNRAEPAAWEGGPALRALLRRLDVVYDAFEEALLYGVQRGWSCAGLLQ
jgi:ParB family chromosome partitioning protein